MSVTLILVAVLGQTASPEHYTPPTPRVVGSAAIMSTGCTARPDEPLTYDIAACIDPAAPVYDLGAYGRAVADIAPAIEAAQADCLGEVEQRLGSNRAGCRYVLTAGVWYLSRGVEFAREDELVGAGGQFWGARTRVYAAPGVTAILALGYAEARARGLGGGGHLHVHDLLVQGLGRYDDTTYTAGIHAENNVTIERVVVWGFVNGVRVDAGVGRGAAASNANGFTLRDLHVLYAAHAGLYIEGSDANVGKVDHGSITRGCQYGTYWSGVLPKRCAAIVNSSFLGVEFSSIITATTQDLDTREVFPWYVGDNLNARNVLLTMYSEGGQGPAVDVSAHTVVVGGLANWDQANTRGLIAQGARLNRAVFQNDQDPNKPITWLMLGNSAPRSAVWRAYSPSKRADNSYWRDYTFELDSVAGHWNGKVAQTWRHMRVDADKNRPYSADYYTAPNQLVCTSAPECTP